MKIFIGKRFASIFWEFHRLARRVQNLFVTGLMTFSESIPVKNFNFYLLTEIEFIP